MNRASLTHLNFDTVEWRVAIEHYYWDRLEEAYAFVEDLGIGLAGRYLRWFRSIQAEYLTRARSERRALTDWLELEFVPEELQGREEAVGKTLVSAADEVASRLRWEHGPMVLASFMAAETDAPWTLGRYGFMVDKYPYDKICLPNHLAFNQDALRQTFAHEYAHVISLNTTGGKIPRWLDEAVSETIEGQEGSGVAHRNLIDYWLDPEQLNAVLADFDDQSAPAQLQLAYAQSAAIGAHLQTLKGDEGIARLLKAFSNNSFIQDLKIAISLDTPADEALREVYGLGVRDLFEQARRSINLR